MENWDQFLERVVGATTKVIQAVKSPTGVVAGVGVPLGGLPAPGTSTASSSAAPLLLLVVVALLVMKA